jgi:hypothetical protein
MGHKLSPAVKLRNRSRTLKETQTIGGCQDRGGIRPRLELWLRTNGRGCPLCAFPLSPRTGWRVGDGGRHFGCPLQLPSPRTARIAPRLKAAPTGCSLFFLQASHRGCQRPTSSKGEHSPSPHAPSPPIASQALRMCGNPHGRTRCERGVNSEGWVPRRAFMARRGRGRWVRHISSAAGAWRLRLAAPYSDHISQLIRGTAANQAGMPVLLCCGRRKGSGNFAHPPGPVTLFSSLLWATDVCSPAALPYFDQRLTSTPPPIALPRAS